LKKLILFLFLALLTAFLSAQENDLINIDLDDIDSIFDEPVNNNEEKQIEQETSILKDIRRRGIELTGDFSFKGAANPGWDMHPWEFNGNENFSWVIGIKMAGSFRVNAQLSDSFRVLGVINFGIPSEPVFWLGDFFFDYNFYDKVFLRAGKYEQAWGISPNFAFTNLLTRVPNPAEDRNDRSGPSYLLKFDIPIGLGGLQLLTMTRVNIQESVTPESDDFGYGAKFNLAFNRTDFNLGFYYQDGMAFRGFFSAKVNIWKTDFYNEWLMAYNAHKDKKTTFAVNFGFVKSLFNNRLDINGEFFYNGEDRTSYFHQETDYLAEGTSGLPHGISFAFNILYKFNVKMNPRLFATVRYSLHENSASVIPGFRITPFQNLEIYFAVPMALGNKEGCYYENSFNILNETRPFSFLLYITFSGSVRAGYYF